MSDECIHGFENGVCAICFPPRVPATVAAVTTRAPRARAATRPAQRLSVGRPKASAAPAATDVNVGEQRIYHVTHRSNLAEILSTGRLLADSDAVGRAVVDVSTQRTREARQSTLVPGAATSVADYVPFFLAPDAVVWDRIRAQEADSRLATEVSAYPASEFVMLVSTVKAAFGVAGTDAAGVVVTDGDAGGSLTRFAVGRDDAERMLRRIGSGASPAAQLEAELLVKGEFPVEELALIGVSDEKVRNLVKHTIAESAHRVKVAVYPPWFRRQEVSPATVAQ